MLLTIGKQTQAFIFAKFSAGLALGQIAWNETYPTRPCATCAKNAREIFRGVR